jgi:FkbM family methyltransferase
MKVAHFSVFAPNKCGLYHTAKELVLAERLAGIDARFIACDEKEKQKDGDFETEELKWAYRADILVRHSVIPTHLHNAGIPVVLALHGRPESSMRLDQSTKNKVITSIYNKAEADARYKAYVAFWPEYIDIWSDIVPKDKLFYAPATVDLDEYKPENKPYDLGKYNSSPNILIADLWREDVTPFNTIFSAAQFVRANGGKIHLAGIPKDCLRSMSPFLMNLRNEGIVGHIFGQIKHIKGMYAACDMLVTPHVIATRTIREALASGLPVVAGAGCKYTPYTANPMDIHRFADAIWCCWDDKNQTPREMAQKEFNLKQSGEAMKKVFDAVLAKKSTKRKVFIDLGGHTGETVRRFYREMNDADEWEIYSFEPDAETFKLLDENIGHIRNVNLVNACASRKDGIVDFFAGKANQNEGGTLVTGKQTGRVKYDKPTKVESVDFARWFRANITNGEQVILKANIEGGEYDLMELLLDEGLTERIDKTFIQLHAHKFEHGQQRQRFQQIEGRFWNEAKCEKYLTNKGFYPFNVD